MKKRTLLIVLFVITVLAAIIAATALSSHAEVYSGKLRGNEGEWVIDTEKGLLTITGNGEIYGNKTSGTPPWDELGISSSIKTIMIGEGITKIGYAAFLGSQYTSITIPKSVTCINDAVLFSGLDIYYYGTEEDWKKIECESDIYNLPVHYNGFSDVKFGTWYTSGVLYCADKGYMSGTSGDKFSPNDTLTRAMFVPILAVVMMKSSAWTPQTANLPANYYNALSSGQADWKSFSAPAS